MTKPSKFVDTFLGMSETDQEQVLNLLRSTLEYLPGLEDTKTGFGKSAILFLKKIHKLFSKNGCEVEEYT